MTISRFNQIAQGKLLNTLVNYMEKESEKKKVGISITNTLCYIAVTNVTM